MPVNFEKFDARVVPLAGSNLIEASAGTGKTYSIAILVLRLLLEKQLPIKEILMVTFTKAAVAELEERIRLFVRLASRVSQGEPIQDDTIRELVQTAIAESGEKAVQDLLKEAVLFLDETSVLTIHSFCQQTLNEFAFETRQLFGADVLQDMNPVLEDEINKFWRATVTTCNKELLMRLMEYGYSKGKIAKLLSDHLSGKSYLGYNRGSSHQFSSVEQTAWKSQILEFEGKENEARQNVLNFISNNAVALQASCQTGYAKNSAAAKLIGNPKALLDEIIAKLNEKKTPAYIYSAFGKVVDLYQHCKDAIERKERILQSVVNALHYRAIEFVSVGIASFKQCNNQMSFDDLIVKMHEALVARDNPLLIEALRTKYKAVFIDEFQDTDRLQYEVFQKAFGEGTILFYIGDPKQSIYAWRKADIFTYFKAQEAVDQLYSMNHNFRSSERLIRAMNLFFKPREDFDTFFFGDADNSIDYIPVESPLPNTKGDLQNSHEIDVPITVSELPNKPAICDAVTAQVMHLLTNEDYRIGKLGTLRAVKPADIGILVRKNSEGRDIKAKLAKCGIPAVTIGDDKVLKSPEAKYVLYILEAIADISRSKINRAILSPFTGYTDQQVLLLDDERATELFRKYKAGCEKEGVYKALNEFAADFNVRRALLGHNSEAGERVITNLYQLIELLHQVQSQKRLSIPELISWLKRGIEGMETEGDEFQQRIESDEEAVKIVTIHKSKGLEYKIVLAPFLDFQIKSKHETCSFRDPDGGEYVSAEKSRLSLSQTAEHERQLEQENRRLLYVAITRAVYKCFIYRNTHHKTSSLMPFTGALDGTDTDLVEFKDALQLTADDFYKVSAERPEFKNPVIDFRLLQPNWRRMSYTALRADHEISQKSRSAIHDDIYEQFIFSQLKKGATTGNMLHHIFENIRFDDHSKWRFVIENAIRRFSPGNKDLYGSMLDRLASHVLHTPIFIAGDVFRMSEVQNNKCLNELEFDFTVPVFDSSDLSSLSEEGMQINVTYLREIEGMMNGKIDLFFEHNGKYYILDWKSNYLGDSLSDYSADKLSLAMNENNYHLQYLIYTLAVKKYLESRVPSFDYESQFGGVIYLFVRGIRQDGTAGIYTNKPSVEKIEALSRILATEILQEPV